MLSSRMSWRLGMESLLCVCVCVCMCVCVRTCVCTCVCVRMCVCIVMCLYACQQNTLRSQKPKVQENDPQVSDEYVLPTSHYLVFLTR